MGDSVVLETSMGEIQLELYWNHACGRFVLLRQFTDRYASLRPQTCKNFAELANRGYYNGVIFHRIIAVCELSRGYQLFTKSCFQDFMVQGGDPTGTGKADAAIDMRRSAEGPGHVQGEAVLAFTVKSCTCMSHTSPSVRTERLASVLLSVARMKSAQYVQS
jgi:cyclophilin family peptidyl-prolyl cis-trans isomerase